MRQATPIKSSMVRDDPPADEKYVLHLYVAGVMPKSLRAIATIKAICEEYLQGCYELEVIDVCQQPVLTRDMQIVAAPTLIKRLPLPFRRLVGDLSKKEQVLIGLGLRPNA